MSQTIVATIPNKPQLNEEIKITEKAATEIRRIKAENKLPDSHALRLGVKGGGCSGFTYVLGFDSESKKGDEVFELHGIKILVDPKSLFYISGTELDFSDGLNGKGFVFNNPKATKTCGCGSSFSA